jgi:LAO/AO transport system kinase
VRKIKDFIDRLNRGDPVALGRLLKELENETLTGYNTLKEFESLKENGKAHVVGITGPPGAGKSTLVSTLCKRWAEQGRSIGIICIDPTSPFTGGAILGDRIRMQELSKLSNIFIKSLATRGSLGGTAASAADIVRAFDSFGVDIVVVETVGVGQSEYDILDTSDTVVLINVPGLGDKLQTFKAGIMEIADIYVINQADRPGADQSVMDLQQMIHDMEAKEEWSPPVLKTIATEKKGIQELADRIEQHKTFLLASDLWQGKREGRNLKRLHQRMMSLFSKEVDSLMQTDSEVAQLVTRVKFGHHDPFTAADQMIEKLRKHIKNTEV